VRHLLAAVLVFGSLSASAAVPNCRRGELSFNFSNIPVKQAFAIFADFAGLKPRIDPSIDASEPMRFGCTNWRDVAEALARQQHLRLEIRDGVMYVRKK